MVPGCYKDVLNWVVLVLGYVFMLVVLLYKRNGKEPRRKKRINALSLYGFVEW
jgi:hypothetical protein